MITLCIIMALLACLALFAFDFQPVLDNTDEVPEKFKPLYAKDEKDGKFKLDADVAKKVDTTGLNSALEKERKSRKDLEKKVSAWTALGESPEEIKARLDELVASGGASDDDKKKLLAKIKADAEASVTKVKGEFEGKLNTMQTVLKKQMIDGEARAAIAELKGVPDLLLPHVREKCLLMEEDGVYIVRVVDAEGDPRGNGKGGFMTIKELVAEMRESEVYGRAFEADGKTGSGTRPANGGGSRDGGQKLTPIQKISRGLAKLNNR